MADIGQLQVELWVLLEDEAVDGALGVGGQRQVIQQGGGDSLRVGLLCAP